MQLLGSSRVLSNFAPVHVLFITPGQGVVPVTQTLVFSQEHPTAVRLSIGQDSVGHSDTDKNLTKES